MAHFILEYSANLEVDSLELNKLFGRLHQSAVDSGHFPLAGIRSRAYCSDYFRIADGTPEYAFVHLHVKLGTGRTDKEKQNVAKLFFGVLNDHLKQFYERQGLAISFEMTELPAVLKFNQNNLRDYMSKGNQ